MVSKSRTHSRFSLRVLDAQEVDFLLEVVGHVVRAMIVTQLQSGGDVLGDGAEVFCHTLPITFIASWYPRAGIALRYCPRREARPIQHGSFGSTLEPVAIAPHPRRNIASEWRAESL